MANTFANGRTFRERLLCRLMLDPSGCLVWTGCLNDSGYGLIRTRGRNLRVHRVMWEMFEGPIPDELQIDHLCRNRACANVTHLEPVTQRENLLRGETVTARLAAVTHCPQGHEYTPENTYRTSKGTRGCRECGRERYHRNKIRKATA
jgi:hypothetical protein